LLRRIVQMKRISLWTTVFLLPAVLASAQEIKCPVFFLRYEGGTEIEELEDEPDDEDESLFDSQRHKITLRIKEQWSNEFTTNLYTAVLFKLYDEPSDNYRYFFLNPNYIWDITDRLRWTAEFRSKWTLYNELDSYDKPKDLTSLRVKTELTFKLLDQLKIIPSFQSVLDLYENSEKIQQIYTAGLRFESRINPQVHLNGRYRVILRTPLGPESTVVGEDKHEFGINLSWDPNK
jgi:hypothetical protein